MIKAIGNLMKAFNLIFILLPCLLYSNVGFSTDVVRWNHGNVDTDKRRTYKAEVITQALEKTIPEYGAYRLSEADQGIVPQRAIQQLQEGRLINIFMAVTSPEWESKTIPIRIPIRRGILNYRLLTINHTNLRQFLTVDNQQSLKKYRVGLRRGWATVPLMEGYGYPILQQTSLNDLYNALLHHKIDYIPRGINEVFDEVELHRADNEDLVIEPHIALHTQAPFYIFVSPKEKRLAQRLKAGLEIMIADNSLKTLFDKYYADKIAKARLFQRKVIHINNPSLSPETPLDRKELWFEYDSRS